MGQITAIAPTASAVANTSASSIPVDTAGYSAIVVTASGASNVTLTGAETVTPYILSGGSYIAVVDSSGTAMTLTATVPMRTFVGGPTYKFAKSAADAAAVVGVFVDLCR